MKLLITGGAGFIGSCAVRRAIEAGHDVLTLDKLTYAGRREALDEVMDSPRHRLVEADIADGPTVRGIFSTFQPDAVLHLAAESHVDRSIDAPAAFVTTNVIGSFVLLEAALEYWSRLGDGARKAFRFVHVSTDEVFGTLGETGRFDAASPYAPNSPYAASKAASDHLARAWHATFGLPTIVTNCSNNYGPRQNAEKLIPTVIRSALAGKPVPIYGAGTNVRDWIHCDDHVAGLLAVLDRGRPGATYLFGGNAEATTLQIAQAICAHLDRRRPRRDGKSHAEQIVFVADRPGHDFRYAIDSSVAAAELGWRPRQSLADGLAATVDWYLAHPGWLELSDAGERIGTRLMAAAPAAR